MFFSAVSIRVIQKRIKQNFTRKIRTILKTWSLSIPKLSPEIFQNGSQQRKHGQRQKGDS